MILEMMEEELVFMFLFLCFLQCCRGVSCSNRCTAVLSSHVSVKSEWETSY